MKRSRSDEVDLEDGEQGGLDNKKKSNCLLLRLAEEGVDPDEEEASSLVRIDPSPSSSGWGCSQRGEEERGESRMTADESPSSPDSLFSSSSSPATIASNLPGSPPPSILLSTDEPTTTTTTIYSTDPPPIAGLHFLPSSIPASLEASLLCSIREGGYFSTRPSFSNEEGKEEEEEKKKKTQNQAMLFGRARLDLAKGKWHSGLPGWIEDLVEELRRICRERDVSLELRDLLFPESSLSRVSSSEEGETEEDAPAPACARLQSRQVILNHYRPPQGLASHIDLPTRFADGILLCSLVSGIGMSFRPTPVPASPLKGTKRKEREDEKEEEEKVGTYHRLYLPPRSILILSGEARWEWEHGIEEAWGDWVLSSSSSSSSSSSEEEREREREGSIRATGVTSGPTFIPRAERISITIRFLQEGADCVGQEREVAIGK